MTGAAAPMLRGKLAIVTGATAGVGRETALGLAKLGATVLITGRDPKRLADTQAWLEAGAPGSRVLTEQADFASLRQVRAMAERILAAHPAIDLLVNNAGLIMTHRVTTEDGFETTWQVNHLAPFLLTNLLLPALKAAAPSRIVTVASDAANYGRIVFDDLNRWPIRSRSWPTSCSRARSRNVWPAAGLRPVRSILASSPAISARRAWFHGRSGG